MPIHSILSNVSTHRKWVRNILGFTLVELIVVITILAILGTIAFTSLTGFQSSARDSVRVSDLSSIQGWLSIYQVKTGGYPLPDNPVSITASGTPIGSQGYAGASVLSLLKMSDVKDPLDRTTPYTYLVNSIRTKYQLLSFLEDGSNVSLSYRSLLPAGEGLGVSSVYADTSDYSKRFVLTKGDALGVLLASGTMVPVQVSGTGVDILNTTGSYVMQFDNSTKVSGSGIVLKSGIVSTKGLVGYWDMETMSGGKLMDLSGNGNDGTMSGTTSSGGKLGNGRSFNGVSDYINIMQGVTLDIPNTITVSSWIKAWYQTSLYNGIISKTISNANGWELRTTSGDASWTNIQFRLNGDSGATNDFRLNNDQWYHLAWTYDGNSSRLYVNGVLVATNKYTSPILIGNIDLQFGKLAYSNRYFSWLIDEVRIYKRALGDSEIQALYNATK